MLKVDYNLIAERFSSLSEKKQRAFILILIERQFVVYKKMCQGKEWSREKEVTYILDECWKSIIYEKELGEKLLELCIETNPENLEYDDEDDEKISFLTTTIDDITAYVRLYIENEAFDQVFSRCNCDYLEGFLYQYYNWKPLSTDLVLDHELVKLEYSRSVRDLEYLKINDDISQIYSEYHQSKNESILGDYWFNDNF